MSVDVEYQQKIESLKQQLQDLLRDARELPVEEIAVLLIHLSACQTALAARMSPARAGHAGQELVEDRLLSISDVSRLVNIRKAYIYDLAKRGQLPTVRIGKHLRVHPTDLRKWIDRHRDKGIDSPMSTRHLQGKPKAQRGRG